jgi:Rho-binding antiterminator
MNFKSQPYKPISCSFHDRLESIAVLRKVVKIIFMDEAGNRQEITSQIVDFKNHDGAEFMVLPDGQIIRLDKIINVDGKSLPKDNNPSC